MTIFSPLPIPQRKRRFTIAVLAAGLAVLLRWILDPLLGHVAFYVTVYIAVAYCVLVCGWVPAVLSSLLGFFGIFYWFVDPRHSLSLRVSELHGTIGFFLVCAVLTALGHANRRKQIALQSAHDLLEERVADRTRELSQAMLTLESEMKVRAQAEDQLRHLSLRLMTLQDDERRQIARELHDTAGQTLAAMKMSVALIRQSKSSPANLELLVDDLNALADEALQEVRTASYLLHPPLLDEAGIASATRWFLQGFAQRSGIEIHSDISDDMDRPSRHCELVLFRVLQESLTNVHRHSQATAATIRLRQNGSHLFLEIADNGQGIPPERLSSLNGNMNSAGVGLTGMRERVRELGGKFEIHSGESGTTVQVALPVLQAQAEPIPATAAP